MDISNHDVAIATLKAYSKVRGIKEKDPLKAISQRREVIESVVKNDLKISPSDKERFSFFYEFIDRAIRLCPDQ